MRIKILGKELSSNYKKALSVTRVPSLLSGEE